MFYALAHLEDSFLGEALHTFAATDPCTVAISEGDDIYNNGLFHFEDYGIYALGPNPSWEKDLATICANFNKEICEYAAAYSWGEPVSV